MSRNKRTINHTELFTALDYRKHPLENYIIIACICAVVLFCASILHAPALHAQGTANLDGIVWIDADRDALFEPDTEAGAPNVTVALLNADGDPIIDPASGLPRVAQTNGDGGYTFANVADGDYRVHLVAENFANGTPLAGYASSNGDALDGGIRSAPITHPLDPADGARAHLGLYRPLRLSGTVWHDANADGASDNGREGGIEGVAITIRTTSSQSITTTTVITTTTIITTTTTADDGSYGVDDLIAGEYVIEIDAANFQIGEPLHGVSENLATTQAVDLQGDEPFEEVNFGFYRPAQIGNLVWFDYNADGIQSASELGVAGVAVRLFGADDADVIVAETVTDAAGQYLFTDLRPDRYQVEFALDTLPAGYVVSQPGAANPLGDAVDSDADPATGRTAISNFLASGSGTLDFDMGIHTLVSVGDRVWYDNDGDGVQDLVGEPGVPDVTLRLYYANTNQPVLGMDGEARAATTNAAGEYVFDSLQPGNYFVTVISTTLPSGFQISPPNVNDRLAAGDAVDSDFDPATARSSETGLLLGDGDKGDGQKMDLDLGIFSPLSIGDMVWFDRNGDGIYTPGGVNGVLGDADDERGVPDVLVTLYDTNTLAPVMADGVMRQTRTDSQGGYIFGNLAPGDYYLQFHLDSLPPGYQVTLRNATTDERDSDVHPTTGRTAATGAIEIGQHQLDFDMGVWLPVGIAGRAWLDEDADGRRDAGENERFAQEGLTTIQAHLYRTANDQQIASAALDANGYYTFTNAPPGDYYVKFNGLPAGYEIAPQTIFGAAKDANSDVDPASGRTAATGNVPAKAWITALDIGLYKSASVSGLAWQDLDADGIRGAGEPSAPNIGVQLYRANLNVPEFDQLVGSTTTDGAGLYRFDTLVPGTYYVRFDLATLPADHVAAKPNAGLELVDSDANPSSGRTAITPLIRSGADLGALDLGIHQLSGVRIGDSVWHDLNANGIQDPFELGIAGVLLQLYATSDPATGPIATTVSDDDGVYLFDGLPAGDYFVKIDPSSLPADYLTVGPRIGNDAAIDSDIDPASGASNATGPIAARGQVTSVDVGLFQPASLGDRAWLDANANGKQDAGEAGLAGVTVTLYTADGLPTGRSAQTDADGAYRFDNLTPGLYRVGTDLPNGYRFSSLNSGGAPGVDESDSDIDPASGRTAPLMLYSGQQNRSFDAGLRKPLVLADVVWLDSNNNGLRDESDEGESEQGANEQGASEQGIANVTLNLYNAQNEIVATTTSDAAGQFEFIDLVPGDYTVHVVADNFGADQSLADLYSSQDNFALARSGASTATTTTIDQGLDSATPSLGGIRSQVITMQIDEPQATSRAAFGFYAPLSIGNRVWHDVNNNGVFDTGADGANGADAESGIDGVLVNLYRDADQDGAPDGDAIANLFTRDGGYYLFDNLGADHYVVEVDAANFQPDGALARFANSWQIDQTDRLTDSTDRGIDSSQWRSNGIRSGTIALVPNSAPQSEGDLGPLAGGLATNGSSDLTVDFGFFESHQIASRIWFDDDNSGATDSGENGVNEVLVELYRDADGNGDPDGSAVMTTTTHADLSALNVDQVNGYFEFDGLPAGRYVVQVPASNFMQDGPLAERLNSTESRAGIDLPGFVIDDGIAVINPYEIGIRTPMITLPNPIAAASRSLSAASATMRDDPAASEADFGFFETVEVGGKVWKDYNANGMVEPDRSEAGVPGVLAILRRVDGNVPADLVGDSVAPQTTNDYGLYRFLNLPPGDYYVEFDLTTLPDALYSVTVQDAAGVDDSIDSDVDPQTGLSTATGFLASGQTQGALNMGIYAPINVGGVVWFDNAINGLHEMFDGEMGVPNVVATLHSVSTGTALLPSGRPITRTTDANGYYVFEGLQPDNYYVTFDLATLPAAHRVTLQDAFPDDGYDSDADPQTGQTAETGDLAAGDVRMELDMGIFPLVAVGDRVWFDDNQDGQQNPGEMPVPDIRVTLYSTATNAPVPDPALSSRPWVQVTDADGRYLFTGLETGIAYYVVFDLMSLPLGYQVTTPNVGGDGSDSDADPISGRTPPTNLLQEGNIDLTLDMGIIAPSGIGDRVWLDRDADGLYEPEDGEVGVENVDVTLYRIPYGNSAYASPVTDPADPTSAWLVSTDEFGRYLFTDLPAGEYQVRFDLATLPAGHAPTLQNVGIDDEIDSDVDPQTGQSANIGPIFSGAQDMSLDMGIVGPVSVGSRVWFDDNRNGVQDDGEEGVPNVSVAIMAVDGSPAQDPFGNLVAPVLTDGTGNYLFDSLLPGAYIVDFNLGTLPAGYVVSKPNGGGNDWMDSDANIGGGWTPASQVLQSGEADNSLAMGIHEPFGVRVGDSVWHDLNANAIRELGELGIMGVRVALQVVDSNGNRIPTGQRQVTDADGNYLFDELPAGSYAVVFDLETLPAEYEASGNRPDNQLTSPSNVDIFSGETVPTAPLTDREQMVALDLGLYKPVNLGDFAWFDRDADGTYDVGELGLSGVTVTLLNEDGSPTGRTAKTDLDGRYLFDDLVPGSYLLEFLAPAGYSPTARNQGPDSSVDSDIDPDTRRTALITVQSDREDLGVDAGFFLGAAVGNFVWLDKNANGIQDEGERGIPGATVRLYSPLGVPVRETYTDLNGFYGFSGLADAQFFLEFIAKEDLVFTPADQNVSGAGDTNATASNAPDNDGTPSDKLDSDAIADNSTLVGRTLSRQLQTGVNYRDWDAGLTPAASVGNYVWFDFDQDGTKDADESGVNGVKVYLYDEDARIVATTVTDKAGFYQFARLMPGKYQLLFEPPNSFRFTERANGGVDVPNSNADSDVNAATGETDFFELLPGQNDTFWGAGLIAAPGAITLSEMSVKREIGDAGEQLIVRWVTSAELDTFGFHIRRGTNGNFENSQRVTNAIIPSQGATGGIYEFAVPYDSDTDLPVGLLDFWLVEIEIDDMQNVHGPVGVAVRTTHLHASGTRQLLPVVIR